MARGAMGNNPPRTMQRTPEQLGLQRLSAGVYRDKQGNLTDSTGRITRRAQQPKPATPSPTPAPAPVTSPPPPVQQQPAPTVNPNQITMGKGEFAQGTSFDKSALPGDFNWQTYVNNYEDLRKAGINTENEALAHYYLHGRTEGRNYGAPPPVQQQPTPTQPTPVEQPPVEEKPVPIVQDTTGGTGATGTGGGAAGGTGATGTGGGAAGGTGGMVNNMGQRDERQGGAFGTNPTERNANPIYTAEGLFGSAGQFYTAENPKNIGSMVQPQFTQQMQQAGDAIYNEFTRRAEPEFERQRAALEQQMYERGLDPNSQGARLQMDQLMQQQNDARQSIRNQATQQAMAYQQQLFGQGQSIYEMPANIAATLGAPYLENLKAQTDLQGKRELFQFEQAQQAREIEAENVARRENFANDLTKLATQFGNDERLLAQEIEGKLKLGNFDLEADLKKLAASSDYAVKELGIQLQNDLTKIKASGAFDLKLAKVQGQTSRDVARIGGSASVRGSQIAADASTFDTIMRAYGIGNGGGGSTNAKNKFMEKLLEVGGPALIDKIFGG